MNKFVSTAPGMLALLVLALTANTASAVGVIGSLRARRFHTLFHRR